MVARRRRPMQGSHELPEGIALWFAGAGPIPWDALLPGHRENVHAWWALWRREYPDARPPADFHLAWPIDPAGDPPM